MENKPDQDITYTFEFKSKQKKKKTDFKKLIYAILLIMIVCGAACALIFGIYEAKNGS